MSDRSLHLILRGISVSGQYAFDFPCRKFRGLYSLPKPCKKDDTTNLSESNTRFGILLERKDIFNDHQVGFFGIQNGTKLRKDVVKPAR